MPKKAVCIKYTYSLFLGVFFFLSDRNHHFSKKVSIFIK